MDENALGLTHQHIVELKRLVQLDIDASLAYARAIEGVDPRHGRVIDELTRFREDHERHIRALSDVLRAAGVDPPEHKPDTKGALIEGMTALRAFLGTRQALKAMRQNEVLTNKRYDGAVAIAGLPPEIFAIIEQGRDDERRHLAWIEAALEGLDQPVTTSPAPR